MPGTPLCSRILSGRPGSTVLAALAAVCGLLACEPPQAPAVCGAIPQQTIVVGESVTVTACFDDPDGDMLGYTVWISDSGVATVTGSGATVTVTAVSPGNALVTILADNQHGLKAQQSFQVLVPNRPPVAVGEIADREVMVGDSATLDLSGYFSEPDGQALSYTVASDSSVATASVTGAALTVVAVAKGTTAVTLTATDPGGLKATQSFSVTVPNRAPVAEGSVSAQTVEVGDTATVDMSLFFSDPDGDALSYSAVTSDTTVAAALVADSTVMVAAVAKGEATITVTATDTEGLAATQSFLVTVPNRAPTVTSTPPDRFWVKTRALPFQGWRYFEDPDDDPLTYTGASSNTTVATIAQQSDIVFEVQARSDGTATITVTARDPDGLTVDASFEFEVGNNAPTVKDPLSGLTSSPSQLDSVIMNSTFEDSDGGDELSYSASSSAPAKATVSVLFSPIYGYYAAIRGVEVGEATVTMTARDLGGLTVDHSFVVTVESNRPPRIKRNFPGRVDLTVGDTTSFVLSEYFDDPDGDDLTYSAAVGFRASAHMSADTLRLVGVIAGITVGEVTAEDTGGKSVAQTFPVFVQNPSSPSGIGPTSGSPTETGSLSMGGPLSATPPSSESRPPDGRPAAALPPWASAPRPASLPPAPPTRLPRHARR